MEVSHSPVERSLSDLTARALYNIADDPYESTNLADNEGLDLVSSKEQE